MDWCNYIIYIQLKILVNIYMQYMIFNHTFYLHKIIWKYSSTTYILIYKLYNNSITSIEIFLLHPIISPFPFHQGLVSPFPVSDSTSSSSFPPFFSACGVGASTSSFSFASSCGAAGRRSEALRRAGYDSYNQWPQKKTRREIIHKKK